MMKLTQLLLRSAAPLLSVLALACGAGADTEAPEALASTEQASFQAQSTYIILYENPNYSGASQILYPPFDINDMAVTSGGAWNDRVSSLRVVNFPPGLSVSLYEHPNWGGLGLTVSQDIPDLRPLPWYFNDVISSLKWNDGSSTAPYVMFYEHPGYTGVALTVNAPFDINLMKGSPNGDFNDRISSIRVFNGASILVYEHPNWAGSSLLVNTNIPDLRNIAGGYYNDAISSMSW
jgi:hypothetical protein